MSNVREVQDLVDLCEEQGFVVRRLNRAGGWQIFPKDRNQSPVCLYDGRSGGRSQTTYLNQRSALRRIGVKFPELEHRKAPKEDETMQRPTISIHNNGAAQGDVAPTSTASTPKPDARAASERLAKAMEYLELAVMEAQEAQKEYSAAVQPLLALGDLVRQIRG